MTDLVTITPTTIPTRCGVINCSYGGGLYSRAEYAQAKGAAAVLIYNNVVDNLDMSGGTLQTPDHWVPTVSVTLVGNPGDLNCDNTVDLADAIVALQVMTGKSLYR
jgi:hypothetical protein